jgi:arsenate reductase
MSHAQERRLRHIVPQPRQWAAGCAFRFASRPEASLWIHEESPTDMKATIYHNPMCGTSRKTLDILRQSGADVWVREYLKNPPSREELSGLYERAGITPREGLRAREPLAGELGLTGPDVTDDAVLDAMIQHPVLIERPLVETANGVRLCRPQDRVREIL